ncbi:phosphodiester glycosidase family protein [Paenibacillus marinisediminis]
MKVKVINRTFMMITAPFIGMIIWMFISSLTVAMEPVSVELPAADSIYEKQAAISQELDKAADIASYTIDSVKRVSTLYTETTNTMNQIVNTASALAKRPEAIYNKRITAKLGTPVDRVNSDRITAELYKLHQPTYSGYAMKVKLKDPKAMKMTLGKDKFGGAETTLEAANRYGAVAGVNAGGYAENGGKIYPLSTTMMNGKYLNGFEPSFKDLSFVGLNSVGKLIGGKFYDQSDLDDLNPIFGASFVPHLINDSVMLPIPAKWSNSRAPRTTIGNYKDDQLLIMVVDGYDEKGGSGATLEEMQQKMLNLGVTDAYNLDGGGSSTLVFKGKVVNHPSDGQMRKLPTHFLFFE